MKTPDKDNRHKLTHPEENQPNYQKREEIRMAGGSPGEATPPDMSSADHGHKARPFNENFLNVRAPVGGGSLEDRDTNDGDANSENN